MAEPFLDGGKVEGASVERKRCSGRGGISPMGVQPLGIEVRSDNPSALASWSSLCCLCPCPCPSLCAEAAEFEGNTQNTLVQGNPVPLSRVPQGATLGRYLLQWCTTHPSETFCCLKASWEYCTTLQLKNSNPKLRSLYLQKSLHMSCGLSAGQVPSLFCFLSCFSSAKSIQTAVPLSQGLHASSVIWVQAGIALKKKKKGYFPALLVTSQDWGPSDRVLAKFSRCR